MCVPLAPSRNPAGMSVTLAPARGSPLPSMVWTRCCVEPISKADSLRVLDNLGIGGR